jgi:hypothetical protein
LALSCTDPTFTPSDACTTYAPDASVQCDSIPVFFSADKRYQLVFFNASNPEVSWSKGLSIVAMTAFDASTAEPGVTQCSFVDVLALQFIDLQQSNTTNIGQNIISSQYTFTWYSGGKDVDAGIQASCLNVATPPPPVRARITCGIHPYATADALPHASSRRLPHRPHRHRGAAHCSTCVTRRQPWCQLQDAL